VQVNATTPLLRMEVVADTDGLTSRAGSALLSVRGSQSRDTFA
jgi:hypothetical protein